MKLLLATGIYPPSIGGPATYAKLLFDELPKRGIDVVVCSFDEVRQYPKIIRHIVYIYKLIRKSYGCTIIFAQDPVSVGLPARIVSLVTRKVFFIRVAGDYAWEQAVQRFNVHDSIDVFQTKTYSGWVSFFKKLQTRVVAAADLVITPSDYFKKLVSSWHSSIRAIRIYNGIEMSIVEDDIVDRNIFRNQFGIVPTDFVVVSAGRLLPWKGFDGLIRVLVSRADMQNVKILIVGDGPEMSNLQKLVAQLGVSNQVYFLGRVDRSTMFASMRASDAFILNTNFESFSFQVVEAMKVGLPVIVTDTGSLPELVQPNINGYLFQYNDIQKMSELISYLKHNPTICEQMGTHSRNRALDFSIDATLQQLVSYIKQYDSN
jgi:glycosyltransferase involved in cell wall biosynthesis